MADFFDYEMKIDLNFKVVDDYEEKYKEYLHQIAREILKEAIDNLKTGDPYPQWVTGTLAQSGRIDISHLNNFEVGVQFGAPHAPFVEFGTRPHIAPLGPSLEYKIIKRRKTKKREIEITSPPNQTTNPLDWWAWRLEKKEGIKTAKYGVHTKLGFNVWKKIIGAGTDPHPFLLPAKESVSRRLKEIAEQHGLEAK